MKPSKMGVFLLAFLLALTVQEGVEAQITASSVVIAYGGGATQNGLSAVVTAGQPVSGAASSPSFSASTGYSPVIIIDAASPIHVEIDIKPDSDDNSINLGSNGNVPVAIFSSQTFDATTVDPTTVRLAGAAVELKGKGTPMASAEDVNGDGRLDLVVHVETRALELSGTDATAVLTGQTVDGRLIRGEDTVRIVPPDAAPAAVAVSPKATRLLPAFPDPANPEVWIPYHLSSASVVVLHIHDVRGRLVRTLDLGLQAAGFYDSRAKAAYWDGRNHWGETVASGVYFYTLQTEAFTATQKLMIMR
jgi:hypothetical protein